MTSMRKSLVRGSTLGAGVLLALALLVIVNYFGWKYHHRFDWTSSGSHTLSEKTENILAALDEPIEIVVFLTPGPANQQIYEQVRDLVQLYEAASSQVSVRFMDPARNLAEAQQLADRFELANPNVVVVASGDDKRILLESELAEMDFSGGMGAAPSLGNFRGEQELTRAILELAEDRKPKILFTTGHGERSLDDRGPDGFSTLADLLNLENLEAEEWTSLNQASVPADADLVVIAGPTGTFLPPELEMLATYAATGGRLLVLLDPELGATELAGTGLGPWLAEFGVTVEPDLVVDPSSRIPFYGADTFFVESFGSHPATATVREAQLPLLLSLVRSVREADEADTDGGLRTTELLFTSAEGWGERDLDNLDAIAEDETDLAGPVPVGVVVERDPETGEPPEVDELDESDDLDELSGDTEDTAEDGEEIEGETESDPAETADEAPDETPAARRGLRMVVLGDSDFSSNRLLPSNAANQVFVSDLLNWMIEREEMTGIPPKEPEQVRLNLTGDQVRWTWIVSLLLLPGAAIALGLWIWSRRRR